MILDESDGRGNITSEYIFFVGKRVARRIVATGNVCFDAEDMLGSSRTIVQVGQTAPCYDADFPPYGSERVITNSCPQNYKFEGKERDTETGNDDFGVRYYSNRFGRWLSAAGGTPLILITGPQASPGWPTLCGFAFGKGWAALFCFSAAVQNQGSICNSPAPRK